MVWVPRTFSLDYWVAEERNLGPEWAMLELLRRFVFSVGFLVTRSQNHGAGLLFFLSFLCIHRICFKYSFPFLFESLYQLLQFFPLVGIRMATKTPASGCVPLHIFHQCESFCIQN